jgi:hypothetical protein
MNEKKILSNHNKNHKESELKTYCEECLKELIERTEQKARLDEQRRFILLLNRLRKGVAEGIDEVSSIVAEGGK